MTMADLLAKQEETNLKLERGQEVEGEVVQITDSEIILDLGSKSEGVLPEKTFPRSRKQTLKLV